MSYDTDSIRSFALTGHGGCGKTSIAEAIAHITGRNSRLGNVMDGTSLLDYEDEEKKRGGSIQTAYLACEFRDFLFHVADTPGDGNFIHEARAAMQAVDGCVLVISATDGVEVSTEKANGYAANQEVPRFIFINKMDKEHANLQQCLDDIKEVLGLQPVLLQLPIGSGDGFKGVVDLVNRQALVYDGTGGNPTVGDIPADLADEVEAASEEMFDAVAVADDDLIEKFFDAGELTQDEVRQGLRIGLRDGSVVPVIVGSATKNIGVDQLVAYSKAFPRKQSVVGHEPGNVDDEIERSSATSEPFAALCINTFIDPFAGQISVFKVLSGKATPSSFLNTRTDRQERFGALGHMVGKTTETITEANTGDIFGVAKLKDTQTGDTLCDPKSPIVLPYLAPPPAMISYTIIPKSRSDVDKLKSALARVLAEDPSLREEYDNVKKATVIAGMGATHINMAMERMSRKYGVQVELGTPAIPYRETIKGKADVRYRHKKQTGGAGQFGEVAIRVLPNERGAGFEFVDMIKGGVIPNALIPSVEKGVRDQLSNGILAGFPVVDVKVELYDGKYHPVDSKDIAFQIAGRQAIKQAVMDCKPQLMEPIQLVDIVCPNDLVGDIMGDLNGQRRGRVLNMESRGRNAVVKAYVPLAEMLSYAPDLKSMTGGKGSYTMEFYGYENVPSHMQEKLVIDLNKAREEAEG